MQVPLGASDFGRWMRGATMTDILGVGTSGNAVCGGGYIGCGVEAMMGYFRGFSASFRR